MLIFNKGKKILYTLGIFALAMLIIMPLSYASEGITIEAEPANGQVVNPGDKITYKVVFNENAVENDWSFVRIQIQDGLLLVEESVLVGGSTKITSLDGDGKTIELPVKREIIHGNNGFVLLSSAITKGDTLVFYGYAKEEGGLTLDISTTKGNTATVSHTINKNAEPENTPAFAYTPPKPKENNNPAIFIIGAAALIALIVACGLYIKKKTGGKTRRA